MPAIQRGRWTRRDVEQLVAENPLQTPRYELVDGKLLVTPSPAPLHQRVLRELFVRLHAYVRDQKIGEAFFSPSDVELTPESYVQPDIYVVPPAESRRLHRDSRARRLLLAVEVLSPGSRRFDRGSKRRFYQRAGVECWIVDPDERLVERWLPSDAQSTVWDSMLTWSTDGADALTIDLVALFASVHGDPSDR